MAVLEKLACDPGCCGGESVAGLFFCLSEGEVRRCDDFDTIEMMPGFRRGWIKLADECDYVDAGVAGGFGDGAGRFSGE